ncbi:MAG: phenylacetate--CoA ligase family protein [Chloroflexi bacterium CFX4]|nr:phenylacetate--CoA ligase family protein [Chloroflexi bacterium CFX4]MDL1922514.1 phenylacetate--CoA ligase [Chloroflexi bacterium CFX3]
MSDLNSKLREAVQHAYANAPAFKQLMDGVGVAPTDIQGVDDLPKIPITSKDKLVQLQQANPPFGGWLAVPMSQLQRIYFSPGPLYDPQGFADVDGAQGAVQALQAGGFQAGDVALNTFLYHMVPAGLWLDEALRLSGITVVPLGPGNTDLLIMVMMTLKPNAYVGTPSFLETVYTRAAQMGITPTFTKAFFTAEPYLPAQREKFEGDYKLRTSQAYGTADLGMVGFERDGKPGFYLPDTLIVEIADPETGKVLPDGEVGEVVVTTFNRAYPLIRFGTGDLSVAERDANGERFLRALVGRSGEALKVRGMFLHPNQLRLIGNAFPQVDAIAASVQRNNGDHLFVQVMLAEGQSVEDIVAFKVRFGEVFKQLARLRADNIELVPSGTLKSGERSLKEV